MRYGFTKNGNNLNRDVANALRAFGINPHSVRCSADMEALLECEPELELQIKKHLLYE